MSDLETPRHKLKSIGFYDISKTYVLRFPKKKKNLHVKNVSLIRSFCFSYWNFVLFYTKKRF